MKLVHWNLVGIILLISIRQRLQRGTLVNLGRWRRTHGLGEIKAGERVAGKTVTSIH